MFDDTNCMYEKSDGSLVKVFAYSQQENLILGYLQNGDVVMIPFYAFVQYKKRLDLKDFPNIVETIRKNFVIK